MTEQHKSASSPARERILQVAADLFYNQGYRATGVNQVIEQSDVAKATFYKHFPSKDDLGQAYLESVLAFEVKSLDEALNATKGVINRYLLPLEWVRQWLRDTEFRGCAFLHAVAEVPDPKNPLRKPGKRFYENTKSRVKGLTDALIASNTEKYGHLDAQRLTESYMVILAGTIAMAEIHHEEWPVDHALNTVRQLIGQ